MRERKVWKANEKDLILGELITTETTFWLKIAEGYNPDITAKLIEAFQETIAKFREEATFADFMAALRLMIDGLAVLYLIQEFGEEKYIAPRDRIVKLVEAQNEVD